MATLRISTAHPDGSFTEEFVEVPDPEPATGPSLAEVAAAVASSPDIPAPTKDALASVFASLEP